MTDAAASHTSIVFYISGHGFGHASREIEVINALLARRPDLHIVVRSTAPRWLFELTVRGGVEYHHVECDTGIVQIDSVRLDVEASLRRATEFMASFSARVADEAATLERLGAQLVAADIPPLGLAAAARAGVPGVAIGNFTWDWIYSAYPNSTALVDQLGRAYASATRTLRLPMHGGFATCPNLIDVPFVARRSRRDPAETRRQLGLPAEDRLVLLSFGGLGLDGLDLDALAQLEGYVVLVSGRTPRAQLPAALGGGRLGSVIPLNEDAMYAAGIRYEDVVRAVDVVVTKPGYGIIAECLANDTALVYTSRGHFLEYDVLVAALPRLLRTAYLDHADLLGGRWQAALDDALGQPARQKPAVDGADVIAESLLNLLEH
ncbi:MAG: hypothetical protein ACT4QD_13765 [Acidobacteriota bacterium]